VLLSVQQLDRRLGPGRSLAAAPHAAPRGR
jgi:hypothetical protein